MTSGCLSRLSTQAQAARARYNAEHAAPTGTRTYVGHLLPGEDDRKRYALEDATRRVRQLTAVIRSLTCGSLRDGHEHAADFPTFRLGIIVRADDGHETYVAVRVTGTIPEDLVSIILRHVPGCDPELWDAVIRLPERPLFGSGASLVQPHEPCRGRKTPRRSRHRITVAVRLAAKNTVIKPAHTGPLTACCTLAMIFPAGRAPRRRRILPPLERLAEALDPADVTAKGLSDLRAVTEAAEQVRRDEAPVTERVPAARARGQRHPRRGLTRPRDRAG
jgi:hypothetical protein